MLSHSCDNTCWLGLFHKYHSGVFGRGLSSCVAHKAVSKPFHTAHLAWRLAVSSLSLIVSFQKWKKKTYRDSYSVGLLIVEGTRYTKPSVCEVIDTDAPLIPPGKINSYGVFMTPRLLVIQLNDFIFQSLNAIILGGWIFRTTYYIVWLFNVRVMFSATISKPPLSFLVLTICSSETVSDIPKEYMRFDLSCFEFKLQHYCVHLKLNENVQLNLLY